MRSIRLAIIQIEWLANQSAMSEQYHHLFDEAARFNPDLICLPEFSLLPYFPGVRDQEGLQWAEPLVGGRTDQFFSQLAQKYQVSIISSMFEKSSDDHFYDTALIHAPDGKIAGYTRKIHIPSGEGYHETDFFIGYDQYPVHDLDQVKLAIPTCYDQWFPELARIYALNGAEYIHYPTAIGSEPTAPDFDSSSAWQTVMKGHAVANGLFISAANRVGKENDVTFYGSSFVCDPTGNVLAQASRDQVEVIFAELDATVRDQYIELFPLLYQRRPETYQKLLTKYDAALPGRWQSHDTFKDD